MKIENKIIVFITIWISLLFADTNIYNQIENDYRIRNFAFIGPFPKDYNADSLIKTIKSNTFSLKNSINHKGKTYQLIPGIQVSCGILTGKRRVFEYLLDPFLSSMDYAFHER